MALRTRYGERWATLVDTLVTLPLNDPQVSAFTHLLRGLRRNQNMDTRILRDPFNTLHAYTILEGFKGTEEDLLSMYYNQLNQIHKTTNRMRLRQYEPLQVSYARKRAG
jgi:hypothetical protein